MPAGTGCTHTNLYGLCMLASFQGISKLNRGRKDDSSFILNSRCVWCEEHVTQVLQHTFHNHSTSNNMILPSFCGPGRFTSMPCTKLGEFTPHHTLTLYFLNTVCILISSHTCKQSIFPSVPGYSKWPCSCFVGILLSNVQNKVLSCLKFICAVKKLSLCS
jgi:hypothetical protein